MKIVDDLSCRPWPGVWQAEHHTYQPDYIIIGAGGAGCPLAHRLKQHLDKLTRQNKRGPTEPCIGKPAQILVVEAGSISDYSSDSVSNPHKWGSNWGSNTDWNMRTVPQKHVLNRRMEMAQGKVAGGSTSINACMWVRGCNRDDFDEWKEKYGCDGWGAEDLQPYFEKLECLESDTNILNKSNPKFFISEGGRRNPAAASFLKAVEEEGTIPPVDNYNRNQDGVMEGAGYTQFTCNWKLDGKRQTAFETFLLPILENQHKTKAVDPIGTRVHLWTKCHVSKILTSNSNGNLRAVGIQFIDPNTGKSTTINCKREVILCAGGVLSPKLLMLSGIGPADHLKSVGITPVLDVPAVGSNYHDHTICGLMFASKKPMPSLKDTNGQDAVAFAKQVTDHGNTALPCGVEIVFDSVRSAFPYSLDSIITEQLYSSGARFLKFPTSHASSSLFILLGFISSLLYSFIRNAIRLGLKIGQLFGITQYLLSHVYAFFVILSKPKSRGTIRLQSSNPLDSPLIDPKYLSHPEDVEEYLRGLKLARRIGHSHALSSEWLLTELLPGGYNKSRAEGKAEDDKLLKHLRLTAQSSWHPAGACAMGSAAESVVCPLLKVRGVAGLRVADGSVMPSVTSGNTQAAVYAIGLRAADLIANEPLVPFLEY